MNSIGSLSALQELSENWDGCGAGPISAATITAAKKFATDHAGQVWWFAPISNGNVMACLGEREIEISPDGIYEDD
jgi:hypothetical protein